MFAVQFLLMQSNTQAFAKKKVHVGAAFTQVGRISYSCIILSCLLPFEGIPTHLIAIVAIFFMIPKSISTGCSDSFSGEIR